MGAHRAGGRLRPVDARGRSPAAGAVDSNGFILPARACASHISLSGRGVCRRAGRPRSTAGAGARRGRGGGGERRGRGGGETKACVHANVSLRRPVSETMASMHTFVSPPPRPRCSPFPSHVSSPPRPPRRRVACAPREGTRLPRERLDWLIRPVLCSPGAGAPLPGARPQPPRTGAPYENGAARPRPLYSTALARQR